MSRSSTLSNGASRASAFVLPERALRLVQEARWLALAVLALFLLLILATYHPADPGWSHAAPDRIVQNAGGRVGAWFADLLLYLFGLSAYLLAGAMGVSVVRGMARLRAAAREAEAPKKRAQKPDEPLPGSRFAWERWLGFAMLMVGCVALESARLHSIGAELPFAPGGVLGSIVATPLLDALGAVGGTLALLGLIAAGFSLWSGWSWLAIFERVGTAIEWLALRAVQAVSARKDRRIGEAAASVREEQVQEKRKIFEEDPAPIRIEPPVARIQPSERAVAERQSTLFMDLPADTELPPLSLLDEPPAQQETVSAETLEYTSRLIEKKLSDFNVAANVVAAQPGPVITRYEIEPATGVKGSQIVNLSKDLARALSLVSIRVVETIPGKNLMGLELPNARRQTVRLSEILGSQVYANSASPLTLALGKDIAGNAVVADLAKMPHLLVAGTTGSGKSVGVNAMILSILFKSTPEEARLIMIDPKMLELSIYEGIPHLLCPVVTDMKEAANALRWSVAEMERRYKLMAAMGVRNLAGFNRKIKEAEEAGTPLTDPLFRRESMDDQPPLLKALPTIVVVVDEFADMMMIVGKKVEELIARIAQKARAAGIHLILATQRPSVDVITGLIKANIPTRMAFQVSSKIDSRTILDQGGAEQLLGHGDMLYLPPGTGLPIRVHGAFVSDDEVHRVVEAWKARGAPDYIEEILVGVEESGSGFDGGAGEGGGEGSEEDPLYDEAVRFVTESRRASISAVQRKLKIGYNRAARMIEAMEMAGVVTSMNTNGSREVIAPPPMRD